MSDIHEGGCQCGAVRYRTRGAPERAGVCHCRYCQMRTGSAFGISVYFRPENVDRLQGALTRHEFTTESGRAFSQEFCSRCGTTLYWELEALPGIVGIAGGSFDPPTFWYDLPRETFARSRAPFVSLDVAESTETTSSYNPARDELPHLCGGGA